MKIKNIENLSNGLGVKLDIDFESMAWTTEQKDAVKQLFSAESLEKLEKKERDLIKNLRFKIGTGTPVELTGAIICRFDLKCLSIREK